MNIFIDKTELQVERGSLALEHVLFIGAVIAISGAIFLFYGKISDYYSKINLGSLPSDVSASSSGSNSSSQP